MERKRTHYKLYKAKKQWITACSILVVGTGLALANSTVAHADTVPGTNNQETAQTTDPIQGTTAPGKQVTPGQTDKTADNGGVAATSTVETTAPTNQEKSAPASQDGG